MNTVKKKGSRTLLAPSRSPSPQTRSKGTKFPIVSEGSSEPELEIARLQGGQVVAVSAEVPSELHKKTKRPALTPTASLEVGQSAWPDEEDYP